MKPPRDAAGRRGAQAAARESGRGTAVERGGSMSLVHRSRQNHVSSTSYPPWHRDPTPWLRRG
eukprot:2914828-Prymnesium_polylepis.1